MDKLVKRLQITKAANTTLRRKGDRKFFADQVIGKEGNHGDLRVLKNNDGVTLNAKAEKEWYKVKMTPLNEKLFTWNNIQFMLTDSTVSSGTYYWLELIWGRSDTGANTSMSDNVPWVLPVDTVVDRLQVIYNNPAAGVHGWKVFKYKKDGSDWTDQANYDELMEDSETYTPEVGVMRIININRSFKAGDIIAFQHKVPSTGAMDDLSINIITKEYWS